MNNKLWIFRVATGLLLTTAGCSDPPDQGADDGNSHDAAARASTPKDAGTAKDSATATAVPALKDAGTVKDASVAAASAIDSGPPAILGTVARGQYLVDHVLMCGVCHTPTGANGQPDMTKYLAGSRSYDFTDVDGTIVTVNAENLTSHDPEGLHAWTDQQIRTAITKGIDDEMIAMYPIMPYPEYALLTPEDVDSIIQYLRTVPPNDNVVPADFPYFDQNPPVPPVDDSKVPHTTLQVNDPAYAAAERGRYIAKTACLNCHTEELSAGIPDLSKAFAGGKTYTFVRGAPVHTSTNITPDATGLAGWSVEEIANAIKTNKAKGSSAEFCNTHPGGADRLGMMTDADLKDVATYIHTLPPIKNGQFQCIKN